MSDKSNIGQVLAPWPFLVFGALAVTGGAVACRLLGWVRGSMAAFDLAALVFMLLCVRLFKFEAEQMRESAQRNDANRGSMLAVASLVTIVILISVGQELAQKSRPEAADIVLIVATLSLSWLFATLVYALHYAHLFYTRDAQGKDRGGVRFPDTNEPNYWDFAYFSTCLAMTFQTSDVDITSGMYRRVVMFHTLGSFIFNIGIIAFSINILGSS